MKRLNNKAGIGAFFANFKKFYPLLQNLAGKDFKIKYRRSVLGIAWSILNPLLNMLVLTAVFGVMIGMRNQEGVGDFAVYYIVGATMWNFFAEATTGAMTSVLASSALLKKVYIPKYIFPLEKCLFSLINFCFSLIAVAIVMSIRIKNIAPGITILMFPLPVLYCLIFAVGLSLVLSAISVYFQDVIHLYGVVLTLWMYLTPIIYPKSFLDAFSSNSFIGKLVKLVISLNPMTRFVDYFRNVVIYNTVPSLTENLICLAWGLGMIAAGILIFGKLQKKFILYI